MEDDCAFCVCKTQLDDEVAASVRGIARGLFLAALLPQLTTVETQQV